MYYYDIALVHAVLDYDEIYTYSSKTKLALGSLVEAPFGAKSAPREAIILREGEKPSFKTKEILRTLESELLSKEQLELLLWMHQRYFAGFFQLLRIFVPAGVRGSHEKVVNFLRQPKNVEEDALVDEYLKGDEKAFKKLVERELLEEVYSYKKKVSEKKEYQLVPLKSSEELLELLETWPKRKKIQQEILFKLSGGETLFKDARYHEKQLEELLEANIITLKEKTPFSDQREFLPDDRDVLPSKTVIFSHPLKALETLVPTIKKKMGEGQVLVIIPKSFLLSFFENRLHEEGVLNTLCLYPEMSQKKRKEAFHWIKDGDVSVILGTRNALFTPVKKLSAMVLLSCTDENYQTEKPTFDVVECFIKRGELEDASLYLSGESFLLSLTGKGFKGMDLREKIKYQPINMALGGKELISEEVYKALEECLKTKEKALLYMNQLGMASIVLCQSCGEVIRCHRCHQAMSYHYEDNAYHCHYCQLKKNYESECPSCHGHELKLMGGGIEKVEYLIKKRFPEAKILLVKGEAFKTKKSREEMVKSLQQKNYDIILGTRMSSLMPFSNFKMAALLSPDGLAFSPNYNSTEQMYHLEYALASNLKEEGGLYIQTYRPEHPVYNQSFEDESSFLKRELSLRKEDQWPPYRALYRVTMSSKDASKLLKAQEALREALIKELKVEVYGPFEPGRRKIKDRYYLHLVIKTGEEETESFLHELKPRGDIQMLIERNPTRII